MANYQTHHITYQPEWTVELLDWQHKAISIIQNMKASELNLVVINNFRLALEFEILRMHRDLDTGEDSRVIKDK